VSRSNYDWPSQRDQQLARELREAIDDLTAVVQAIAAVHLIVPALT
jgi:hypothetical protein